jgi:hypothetical protein
LLSIPPVATTPPEAARPAVFATPPVLALPRVAMPILMMCASTPVRVTPSVLVPPPLGALQVLASMLKLVPFWNAVLLYEVFPPEEWLA